MYINVCKIKRKAACDSWLATQKSLDHILDLWQPLMRKECSAFATLLAQNAFRSQFVPAQSNICKCRIFGFIRACFAFNGKLISTLLVASFICRPRRVVPSGEPRFNQLLRGGIWKLKLERILSGMCRTENKAVNISLLNSSFGTRKQLPIKMIYFNLCVCSEADRVSLKGKY